MVDLIKEILISEKIFTDVNYDRLKKNWVIERNLKYSDGNMYLAVDSLIKINNMITGSSDISLRKVYVCFMMEMVKRVRYFLLMMIKQSHLLIGHKNKNTSNIKWILSVLNTQSW